MSRRSKGRPPVQLARHRGRLGELLVARLFGREAGSVFEPNSVPQELLEKFMSSDSVRRMACDFAIDVARTWQARYPGQPHLELAGLGLVGSDVTSSAAARGPAVSVVPMPEPLEPALQVAATDDLPTSPTDPITPAKESPVSSRKLHYSLPNAKAGEAYRAVVRARNDQGLEVQFDHLEPPAELGLSFDASTGELHGVPRQPGDYQIQAFWQDAARHRFTDAFPLIVNANPRDLWKNLEADPNDLYFKPSEDSRVLSATDRRIVAASKRGRSHAHVGSFRDDDFFVEHHSESGWSVLLVADGAGSAKSSRKGSALASAHSGQYLITELSGEEGELLKASISTWESDRPSGARPLKDKLYRLFGKAAWVALRALEEEAESRAAQVKDYSTTLLCAIHCTTAWGSFIGSFWLGDGAIAAYGPEGQIRLMGKPDSGEFAGQTRFLDRAVLSDSQTLWDRIDFGLHRDLTSLILMTDGISDPRFETDHGLGQPEKWQSLWAECLPLLTAENPGQALLHWMDFFIPGHHDDRTLAVLW